MKNNKIALFLDVDGTLYDNQLKGMRPKTIELLNELSNNEDYDLYIASGRSMNTIHSIKEIEFFLCNLDKALKSFKVYKFFK